MNEQRRKALRDASIGKRLWWRLKWPWWQLRVLIFPNHERRSKERLTARAAEQALQASLTQMVTAFQSAYHEEDKKK